MQPGGHPVHVVKNGRNKRPEAFSEDKLHRSIVAACASSGTPVGQAESIARRVVSDVHEWLENRPEVTSADIRRVAARYLKTYHPDASYLYEHHRSIL